MLDKVRHLVEHHIGPGAEAVARQDVFAWETFRLLGKEGVIATAFPRAYGAAMPAWHCGCA
jgi:alkylation response protein AidB-like acyl-CoA dehydrogenase